MGNASVVSDKLFQRIFDTVIVIELLVEDIQRDVTQIMTIASQEREGEDVSK